MPAYRNPIVLSLFPGLAVTAFAVCFLVARSYEPASSSRELLIAATAGVLALELFRHRFRSLGLVPFAATALFATAVVGWLTGSWAAWLLGLMAAFVASGPIRYARLVLHGWEVWWHLGGCFAGMLLGTVLVLYPVDPELASVLLVVLTGLLCGMSWVFLFRPAFELTCEPLLWLMYRIRTAGPGLTQVPARGPVLVVANHACWFDPLFLAKVLPRPVTPMMTSRFYDLPVMSWLMRRVFHSIRVPEKPSKEEMPEAVRQAIAALDRGECVVIFPEGFLRRTEERPLRRFGRGVWQILSARPETPVFCCWIEGGWGSYASYFNGKPTKNKRPDFRRPIGVGVSAPVAVDAATLANHLQTRVYLMNRVAEARKLLGLPELPPFELAVQEGKEDEEEG